MPATTRTDYLDQTIEVRRPNLEFGDETPTLWFDDNVYLTSLLNGLAVSFPPGERYFIRSVQHFLSEVKEPKLREAVRAFVGQEAQHTKEHLVFNRFLDGRGLPATPMEDFVTRRIRKIQEASSPEGNLARTAALEHFTAILASALIENPEVLERMSPEVARLWAWHAVEEIEHRSVAFDVYQSAVGDERLRLRTMLVVSVIFFIANAVRTGILARATGRGFEPRAALKAMNVLWGKPGLLRKVLPRYLAYYRPGFHPSQHDNREAVRRAKARWLDEAD
jgi:predicted metal-dependent hydrolase